MTDSGFEVGRDAAAPPATVLPALILLALTFALNANAFSAFFVGDDFDFLRGLQSLDGVGDALTFSFWGEWEPVWWASWYVDFDLWGARPLGFHLTSVLWYGVCVACLFGMVRRAWPRVPFVAWAAALLFATHPVHDEAVTYLAARGHPMATGLALGALWAYAALRGASRSAGRRAALWTIALVCALLAGLAKETALVLPAWAGALEAALARGAALRRLRRAGATAAIFAIPAMATILLRASVVGLESGKLTGALGDPVGLAATALGDLPGYVLLSALPIPLAFASEVTLFGLRWLGWLLLAAGSIGWLAVAVRTPVGRRWDSTGLQLWGVGAVMFLAGLGPVLWADLALRRRYTFSPGVGIVLAASALLGLLHARAPRAARVTLALLVLLGAGASWQRNQLYVDSGALARSMLTTLRGAPLEAPPAPGPREAALLTLPRALGGDSVSGAYLFHHTDLRSALRFYDAAPRKIHYALKCYYADDYAASASFAGRHEVLLDVGFRNRGAYDDAATRDPAEDRFGDLLYAELLSRDPETLRLRWRVHLRPGFWDRADLYLFGDGALKRLDPPDEGPTDLSVFGDP